MEGLIWLMIFWGGAGLLLALLPATLSLLTIIGFALGKLTKKETKLMLKKIWA